MQFDIQNQAWYKCRAGRDAHTMPVLELPSIFTLFSSKTPFFFNTCERCVLKTQWAPTCKRTTKLRLWNKNILCFLLTRALEMTNSLHMKSIQSLLINFSICPSKCDVLCPTNRHWTELTMYIQRMFNMSLSLISLNYRPLKTWQSKALLKQLQCAT